MLRTAFDLICRTSLPALDRPLLDHLTTKLSHAPGNRVSIAWSTGRLIEQRRFAEAEAILELGLARHGNSAILLKHHAMVAAISGRHADAIERWDRLRCHVPDSAAAWVGSASSASELHRLQDAKQTIDGALQRFPDRPRIISEAARIYDKMCLHEDALPLWRKLATRRHVEPAWRLGLALCLMQFGRFDEAEGILTEGARRHPRDGGFLAARGFLEMHRQNWDKAIEVWRVYQARYPNDLAGYDALGRTMAAAAFLDDELAAPPVLVDVGSQVDEQTRQLLLRFESIGRDCEFGLVQRRFGAEPISLLRWHSLGLPFLIDAFMSRFDGLAGDGGLKITVDGTGQYYVTDRRWGLCMYTFLYKANIDETELEIKMRRRLLFLKDKLLSGIEAAEKTLILTTAHYDAVLIGRLSLALGLIGPVKLLIVTLAGPFGETDGAVGEVRPISATVFVGFLSKLGLRAGQWGIQFDEWITMLNRCEALGEETNLVPDAAQP